MSNVYDLFPRKEEVQISLSIPAKRASEIEGKIGKPFRVVVSRAVSIFLVCYDEIKKGGQVHLVKSNGDVLLLNPIFNGESND